MEKYIGMDGIFAIPDIVKDFRNNKTRRRYERKIRKTRKQLRRMNNSRRYKELRANLRPNGCLRCGHPKFIGWGVYVAQGSVFLLVEGWKKTVQAVQMQGSRQDRRKSRAKKPALPISFPGASEHTGSSLTEDRWGLITLEQVMNNPRPLLWRVRVRT